MRVADPKPSMCTACNSSADADMQFIDFEAAREGPQVLDKETGTIAVDPSGALVVFEDVYICFQCVLAAARMAGAKQSEELVRVQLERIRTDGEELRRRERIIEAQAEALGAMKREGVLA